MVRDWTPEELRLLADREKLWPTLRADRTEADRCFNHRHIRSGAPYWTKREILGSGANYMCEECMVELGLLW